MIILAIIGLTIVTIVMGLCVTEINAEGNKELSIVLLIVETIGLLLIIAYINKTPTALDVYKGNTELRITYEGKTPVDSVVIYKK
nr:MAG: hypothetical protein [Bacteriophage sp.]